MNIALTYFITALVLTTNTPPTGWIQYTQAFSDRDACVYFIRRDQNELVEQLEKYFKEKLIRIKTFDCLTREEAVRRNSELGH